MPEVVYYLVVSHCFILFYSILFLSGMQTKKCSLLMLLIIIIYSLCLKVIYGAVKRLIVINRIRNKSFVCIMCVFCVYLLCIYKHTHIQYVFRKYLHVITCLYLCSYNLYYKYIYYINIIFFWNIYMHVCVFMYLYIYIYIYIYTYTHSTHTCIM